MRLHCFPTIVLHDPHHNGCVYYIVDKLFCSVSLEVCVLYYQPLCDFSFCVGIIFKFVAAKILLQHWQQVIIAG
jgi:hypothetical protein